MSINPDINRKRPRIIDEVAVRMSVEVPRALRVARPDPHRIVAKYNFLFRYVYLRQNTPGGKEMLLLSRSLVVIAFNKVDCLTGQALPIGNHLLRSPQAARLRDHTDEDCN
jgi:hypothetical protein